MDFNSMNWDTLSAKTNYVQKDVNDPKIKAEYRTLTIGLTFLAVFCMWLMWVSVYMHQMNPLIVPILEA